MLVIGKIEIHPPFSPELEQTTRWNVLGDGAIRNRALIATGSVSKPIRPGSLVGSDWQEFIDSHWGEYFAVVVPKVPRYLNGVAVPLDAMKQEYLWFPGSMVIRPPSDSDNVYVGTLRYVRNNFNQIVDIQVLDERVEAVEFLRSEYGAIPENLVTALWLRQLPWETETSP